MSTSKLELYNDALMICGERLLHTTTGLTEEREPRRLLDHVWDSEGVDACLEAGQWKFAMRTVMIDYDPDITPEFGLQRAFAKPDDWINTSALCSDEYFNVPLLQYVDEAGYWYAELDTIYVRYVSNDANYGGDLSLWPSRFTNYVAAYFADKIILKLTSDKERIDKVEKKLEKNLLLAKSSDAMAGPTVFPPQGGWSQSRQGYSRSRRDRGSRGQLIG